METYIIKYLLQRDSGKQTQVSVTIDLQDNTQAINICKTFESKGNIILEIYNKSKDETIYNYKKAKYQHVIS